MRQSWTVQITMPAMVLSFTFSSEADMRAFGEAARKAEGVTHVSYGEAVGHFD